MHCQRSLLFKPRTPLQRAFSSSSLRLERESRDDHLRLHRYQAPKHPVVLCHGLLGFDVMGPTFAPLHYWRGIRETLDAIGCQVLITRVPRTADVSTRAHVLRDSLNAKLPKGTRINMIAHSMGGLDCRYMISRLLSAKGEAANFKVNSLTTIATPHHGSSLAPLPFLSTILEPLISTLYSKASLDFRAFTNLTPTYMDTVFNPSTPDVPDVAYFSYGADGTDSVYEKTVMYPFRLTYEILNMLEGVNDGLVSVESAKWGSYMGTVKADHVDLINLFNKWKWDVALKSLDVVEDAAEAIDRSSEVASHVKETAKKMSDDFVASVQRNGGEREKREKEHSDGITHKSERPPRHKWESSTFNAIELYLEIADMLAKRGF